MVVRSVHWAVQDDSAVVDQVTVDHRYLMPPSAHPDLVGLRVELD